MSRINLTLDDDTSSAIDRHARRLGMARAALARDLICEALAQRERLERHRQLARDYAAGRSDASALLADLEEPQLELLDRLEDP